MKLLVALAFAAILLALALAGRAMLRRGQKDGPASPHMARALAWRVGISVTLFALILLAYKLGWIHPTGLPLNSR
jgi:hydrogenase/urease accessory protein HupE